MRSLAVVDLEARHGTLARANWRTLEFDPKVTELPAEAQVLIFSHETAHIRFWHQLLCSIVGVFAFPLWPLVRRACEWHADRVALQMMGSGVLFVRAMKQVYPKAHGRWERWLYGSDWLDRCRRQGAILNMKDPRWLALAT